MSQWTHVVGAIRYDYLAQNCWCSDSNGKPECYNVKEKIKTLKKIYKVGIPSGSEGPVRISVTNSNRGPVVGITGDLRDFGESEVPQISTWLNRACSEIEKLNETAEPFDLLTIRDSIIRVYVEYSRNVLILMFLKATKNWVTEIIQVN